MSLEIYVWDVEHGNSLTLKTPEGKIVMIDCGANPSTDFSPARFVQNAWDVEQLDYLIVSHPHLDHIRDISNIKNIQPRVLKRRHVDIDRLVTGEYGEFEDVIREYVDFEQSYSYPIAGDEHPSTWSVKFANFGTNLESDNINDLGIATFVTYGSFTLLHPGDLEEDGWFSLLENNEFRDLLKRTNFLMASHHGRESGFVAEVFKELAPRLTIVSDGRYQETSVTGRYSEKTEGWPVYDPDGSREVRKVVTTRSDGRIHLQVRLGDPTTVRVDRKPIATPQD